MSSKQIIVLVVVAFLVLVLGVSFWALKSSPPVTDNNNNQSNNNSNPNDSKPGNYSLNGKVVDMAGTVLTLELPDKSRKDVAYTFSTDVQKQTTSKTGIKLDPVPDSSIRVGSEVIAYTEMNPTSVETVIAYRIIITK